MTTKGSGTKIIRIDDHVTTLTPSKKQIDGCDRMEFRNEIMWLPRIPFELVRRRTMNLY
jgi:hypothetical protein